jgi:putative oxidoreductase
MNTRFLRQTSPDKRLIVPRLIAALPLAGFGSFHLTGMTPLMQILEGAGIPFPQVNYFLAPVFMVVAGLSMGLGFYARAGAVIGSSAMLVATYSKLVIDQWPGPMEPPLALPLVVLAACLMILVKGAGNWSLDRKAVA